MNIAEDNNSQNNRQNVFYSSPTQWSQVTPEFMPWGHGPNSPALVTFSAQPQQTTQMAHPIPSFNPQPSTSTFGRTSFISSFIHCKRKADLELQIPNKQHITEEKMAQHMSRLHISTENHTDSNIPMENSVERQKRLYVCEEMRRLQTESILPSSLLGRLERPCMAVMLWQPPAKIPSLLSNTSSLGSALSIAGGRTPRAPLEEDENENNAATADLNNMDMDS